MALLIPGLRLIPPFFDGFFGFGMELLMRSTAAGFPGALPCTGGARVYRHAEHSKAHKDGNGEEERGSLWLHVDVVFFLIIAQCCGKYHGSAG